MAQRTIATSVAAAIVDPDQVAFSLHAKHFRSGKKPVISVEGLVAAETISFWFWTNGDWEELDDGSGTQVSYTATYAADVFNGPGTYGYTKDETVSAITLSLDDGI
jgi:hypothetical protein